jgi:hypothetical protein
MLICAGLTLWMAYEFVYNPPANYEQLIMVRTLGTINGVAAIIGCLSIIFTPPVGRKRK